ncbi:MAG: RagB/SusD family nutrient uptake outer membrane protein [Prevotella sp.]|nr:RagB/SusD family nutrient uptake outer membrane protein [Prevotella sp.]
MKKVIFVFVAISIFLSCSDFLDTENYTKKTSANFPRTVPDADQVLAGIYNGFNLESTDFTTSGFLLAEVASDDRFGGGGRNDRSWQAYDKLMNYGPDMLASYWKNRYSAIYRANYAIENLDKVAWNNETQRNQYVGEAYFLRAYFYFTLLQIFGEVPLTITTLPENLPKSSAHEAYMQIASDLKQAIDIMPSNPYNSVVSGHATKWAAEALMSRMFLFYTGYYQQSELPLLGGSSVTKSQVINWLEDCIANSGHSLISDYRNIWPYTNSATAQDYEYVKVNNLAWEGDGNKETVFAAKFSTIGGSALMGFGNRFALLFGPRTGNGQANTFPFARGWGAGPVNPNFWKDWMAAEPNDVRREGSIIDVVNEYPNPEDDPMGQTGIGFKWGADTQMEEAGYWPKKNIGITAYKDGALQLSYSFVLDGYSGNWQYSYLQDFIIIRFADVLLMHSELAETTTGINLVRERAKLSPVTGYSLQALKQERRFELCFEGQRYYDLMRWGDAADALESQIGVSIVNNLNQMQMKAFGGGYKARYLATGGFYPIPKTQLDLSNGVLIQNKGWGNPENEYPGW